MQTLKGLDISGFQSELTEEGNLLICRIDPGFLFFLLKYNFYFKLYFIN